MKIGEKLRYLRTIEGTLRGLDREMTQQSVSAAIESELGERISQSYLSQIERGLRPHLTNTTRMTLARFFKVHPGYLVDDPEGFHTELTSDVRTLEDNLEIIRNNSLTAVAVQTVADIERDPHWRMRELIVDVPNGTSKVRMHNVTPRFSATPGEIRWAGGALGEHNNEVYRSELGLSGDDLNRLREAGVI